MRSAAHCGDLAHNLAVQSTLLLQAVSLEYQTRSGSKDANGSVIRKLQFEHQEMTTDVVASHFLFSIPTSATPSFRTPMVSLR